MNGTKSALASTGVWGGIAAALSGAIPLIVLVAKAGGLEVSEADISEIVVALTSLGATVGGIVAIIGRMRATQKIG